MSIVTPTDEGSDDILWQLVKNIEFLKYDHSIEQIKPSRFDFPSVTKHAVHGFNFSSFGIEVIKDYLHIGMVNENSINRQIKRSRVLLLVWPSYAFPEAYQSHKLHLKDIKRIKTMVFQVPEDVFEKYSAGNNSLHELVAATSILTQVDEWKLLERAVISSFYHLTYDKATSDLHGNIHIWRNYPIEKLNSTWKQLLFICCGPQGLAYLFKRMLKRNWARMCRSSISGDLESECSVFCTGNIAKLIVEWAKLFFKPDGVVKFLEGINLIKPALSTNEITDVMNASFDQFVSSSKKYRCNICPYESSSKNNFANHMRTHSGETPSVCDICGSAHKLYTGLKHHKIRHHTGNYPHHCKYCRKPFINYSRMVYHVSFHEKKGNVQYRCYKCLFISKDESMLMQHIPTHAKDPTFNCTLCDRVFDSQTLLVAHSRNHSKDKPFKCHICGKGCLLESNLRAHYITHSDSRLMFTCDVCNRSLSSAQSLRAHLAVQHGDTKP